MRGCGEPGTRQGAGKLAHHTCIYYVTMPYNTFGLGPAKIGSRDINTYSKNRFFVLFFSFFFCQRTGVSSCLSMASRQHHVTVHHCLPVSSACPSRQGDMKATSQMRPAAASPGPALARIRQACREVLTRNTHPLPPSGLGARLPTRY